VSGLLWAILAFSGSLGMSRLYAAELEDQALHGLRMAPISYEALFLAKQAALFLTLLLCALLCFPLAAMMFQAELALLWPKLLPVLLLALWGFSILGTLLSTLLLQYSFRETLMPLLFLPLVFPLLIGGARATAALLGVGGIPQTFFWVRLLLSYDLIFFVAGLWLYRLQFEH
ncbi:MAG: heme exporter protein CcmB, partial [Myxococcota bacterium]